MNDWLVVIKCEIGDVFRANLTGLPAFNHTWDKEYFPVTENIYVLNINGRPPRLMFHGVTEGSTKWGKYTYIVFRHVPVEET